MHKRLEANMDPPVAGEMGLLAENKTSAPAGRALRWFFVLVFALSVPLWAVGYVINGSLRALPLFDLVNLIWHVSLALIPMIAALILVRREEGGAGVKRLLLRPFDYRRIQAKMWYLPILFLYPLLMLLEYAWLQMRGVPLPELQPPGLLVPLLFGVFLLAGIGEELGWTGYALDPLQARWTALGASIILGAVSIVWHLVPILQEPHTSQWVFWHSVQMIPLRVLMVWIYNNTHRSMFAVVAFHASVNIGEVVWPFYGISGAYDPLWAALLVTLAALVVIYLWGPKTLARYRLA